MTEMKALWLCDSLVQGQIVSYAGVFLLQVSHYDMIIGVCNEESESPR